MFNPDNEPLQAAEIQNALEDLLVNLQDPDIVKHALLKHVKIPNNCETYFKLVQPDRDAIQVGPIVDLGDGKFTCFATIQVDIEVKPV